MKRRCMEAPITTCRQFCAGSLRTSVYITSITCAAAYPITGCRKRCEITPICGASAGSLCFKAFAAFVLRCGMRPADASSRSVTYGCGSSDRGATDHVSGSSTGVRTDQAGQRVPSVPTAGDRQSEGRMGHDLHRPQPPKTLPRFRMSTSCYTVAAIQRLNGHPPNPQLRTYRRFDRDLRAV